MAPIVLTGGRAKRSGSRRSRPLRIPKLPRTRRPSRKAVVLPSTATATASERAALQSLAQRLQRGNFSAWRSANVTNAAANAAAANGVPVTATDLATGATARAVPLVGSGKRRRASKTTSKRKTMRGGFFPALIPLIAAAIGAIPGIAGTAVGIAQLKEQRRQFDKMYNQGR